MLNRHHAINLLSEISSPLALSHTIPPVIQQATTDEAKTDSDAEINFGEICRKRRFPIPPVQQHRVSFEDGSYTDADWAYPDKKVLIFIDGMSKRLHGDPDRARRDRLLRAKAEMKGYRVVEITAEALEDDGSLAVHFEELSVYLGGD